MKIVLSLILLFLSFFLEAEIKALWVPIWDITTPEKIDTLFYTIRKQDFNQLLVQIRYRGDAAYVTNKRETTYPNPEKKYHGIENPEFDPLEYILQKAEKQKIEIHAWFTIFAITGHDLGKLDSTHVYFVHPEWVTSHFTRSSMHYLADMGSFLDPGIPAVQEYSLNVIMDVVTNYQIDGVHLDYIRYPGNYYGFNELATETYKNEVKFQDALSWMQWKNDQVTRFVAKVSQTAKAINPSLTISAAVFPNIGDALENYAQDWLFWLEKNYIDYAYTMSYTINSARLQQDLTFTENFGMKDKIVVGLRAWKDEREYPVSQINEKIRIALKMDYAGIALFSYTGIRQQNYWNYLRLK